MIIIFHLRLMGSAAVKAKNVCLHLVDEHEYITNSGLVQLFTYPHPTKIINQSLWTKSPSKLLSNKQLRPSMYFTSYILDTIFLNHNIF